MLDPRLRRRLLIGSLAIAPAVLLVVALGYLSHNAVPFVGSNVFQSIPLGAWNGFGFVMLLLLGGVDLVAIYRPEWFPGPHVVLPGRTGPTLHVRCRHCGVVHWADDPGRRPLKHFCPSCGREGVYGENGGGRDFVYTEVLVKLGCRRCRAAFTIPEPLVRPLYTQCPTCGARGVLRRESRPVEAAEAHMKCRTCRFEFDLYLVAGAGEHPPLRCPRCREENPAPVATKQP